MNKGRALSAWLWADLYNHSFHRTGTVDTALALVSEEHQEALAPILLTILSYARDGAALSEELAAHAGEEAMPSSSLPYSRTTAEPNNHTQHRTQNSRALRRTRQGPPRRAARGRQRQALPPPAPHRAGRGGAPRPPATAARGGLPAPRPLPPHPRRRRRRAPAAVGRPRCGQRASPRRPAGLGDAALAGQEQQQRRARSRVVPGAGGGPR